MVLTSLTPDHRCQLVLGVSDNPEVVSDVIVRIYDRFLVWCRLQDCWSDVIEKRLYLILINISGMANQHHTGQ